MIKDLPPPLKSVDKRIEKTKRLLLDSFVALIIEKGYENVTVQDIIDRSKVARSTFYSHFENKEQLLKGDNMARLLFQNKVLSTTSKKCDIDFQRLYSHVKENKALAQEIFGKDAGAMMRDHIHNIMVFAIRSYLTDRIVVKESDKKITSLMIEAAASALTTLLINWSLTGMEFSPGIMADKSHQIVENFFKDRVRSE